MDTEFSGATLTFACVRAGVCYVSHLGEGRAVLGCGKPGAGLAAKGAGLGPGGTAPRVPKAPMGLRRFPYSGKCEAAALTCDHRPNQPEERERVLASGGRVFGVRLAICCLHGRLFVDAHELCRLFLPKQVRYDDGSTGPDKCWVATMDLPGLSCSRSLGDTIGAELAGVASEPTLRTVRKTRCCNCTAVYACYISKCEQSLEESWIFILRRNFVIIYCCSFQSLRLFFSFMVCLLHLAHTRAHA